MAPSLILRVQVQIVSDITCHTDDFKEHHEMGVSSKNTFPMFLLRSDIVPGAVSRKSSHGLDDTHTREFRKVPFRPGQVLVDESIPSSSGAGLGLGNLKDGNGGHSRNCSCTR